MKSHWPLFRKFIRAEKAVGGPDCQFTLMLEHAKCHEPERMHNPFDVMWLIGCYGGHHCAMPAYEVWSRFHYEHVTKKSDRLTLWLDKHWEALPVRREMRSHRMLEKRAKCLYDFAAYVRSGAWQTGTFDEVWDDSQKRVKYYGRYMSIKVLELMHRTVRPDMPSYDIRAQHAWSPRAALALLFPENADWIGDRKRNDAKTVIRVERRATLVMQDLQAHGIDVSYFELQGLLCNYKEMLYGRFYPGAGHDEDMEYMRTYALHFDDAPWWKTRARIFDHKYLGELNGWTGLRPHVGERWMQRRIDAGLHLPPRGT